MFKALLRLGVMGAVLFVSLSAQAFLGPQQLECKYVSGIMGRYLQAHTLHTRVSSKIELRTSKQFVQNLDYRKIYFIEKDVRRIQALMSGLFSKIKKSNCQALRQVYTMYQQRLEQRLKYAKTHLNKKTFKINKQTTLIIDADKIPWPKTVQQADAYHRKYLQFQVATRMADGDTSLKEAKALVVRKYERDFRQATEVTQPKLLEWYLDAFSLALDPHSSYFSPADMADFKIQMELSLDGIGATLRSEDGFTVIHQLMPGGAAEQSGQLQPEDKITAVAQGKGPFQNVVEQDLQKVVGQIRGKRGTKVRLKIFRKSDKKRPRFEVTLIRKQIQIEDARADIHYLPDRKRGRRKVKVALIDVPSFYMGGKDNRSVTSDLRKLLAQAKARGVKSLVLDLSSNGGGSLEDAVHVTGLFLRKGAVVRQSSRRHGSQDLEDKDVSLDWSGPLVVLTSQASASASEIVAGALKDYKRAVVVGGQSTFGKGSVQSVEPLSRGALGAFKTTVGLFYVPGGNSTQQIGVPSDIVLPSVYEASRGMGEKHLDYSLPAQRVAAFLSHREANFKAAKGGTRPWRPLRITDVQYLKRRSQARVAKSEKFKKIRNDIKKAKKRQHSVNIGELLDEEKEDADNKKSTSSKQKAKSSKQIKKAEALDEKSKDEKSKTKLSYEQQKKERIEKYLKRADVLEAAEIAADLYLRQGGRG